MQHSSVLVGVKMSDVLRAIKIAAPVLLYGLRLILHEEGEYHP